MNRLLFLSISICSALTSFNRPLSASENEVDENYQSLGLTLYNPLVKSVGCIVVTAALYQYLVINDDILRSEDDSDAFVRAPEIKDFFKIVTNSACQKKIDGCIRVLKKGIKHDSKRAIIEHHLKTGRLASIKQIFSPLLVCSPFDWQKEFKKVDKDNAAALARACNFEVNFCYRRTQSSQKELPTATYLAPAFYYQEMVTKRLSAQNVFNKHKQFYLYKKNHEATKINPLLRFYQTCEDDSFETSKADLLRHIKNGGGVNTNTVCFEYTQREKK